VSHGEWGSLFSAAFKHSRNAMVLLDGQRRHVDVNGAYLQMMGYTREQLMGQPIHRYVVGGPRMTPAEWRAALRKREFAGDAEVNPADGARLRVQWAATTEVITGRHLVLGVVLSTSRWGPRFRRTLSDNVRSAALSTREREVVRLVALGNTGPEIADELHIAHDTVRTHARNAMVKVGARSRAQLVAKTLGEGLAFDH
jgi:PAS domain S-box-containing protein